MHCTRVPTKPNAWGCWEILSHPKQLSQHFNLELVIFDGEMVTLAGPMETSTLSRCSQSWRGARACSPSSRTHVLQPIRAPCYYFSLSCFRPHCDSVFPWTCGHASPLPPVARHQLPRHGAGKAYDIQMLLITSSGKQFLYVLYKSRNFQSSCLERSVVITASRKTRVSPTWVRNNATLPLQRVYCCPIKA